MGPFGHLARGFRIAYSNLGISLLLTFISFAGSWISGSVTLAMTESWGILFMSAILAGKPATMETFSSVLSRRPADLFLSGLIFFALTMFGTVFLIALPGIAFAIGIPLFLQAGPEYHVIGLILGGLIACICLVFALVWLYILLRLAFTPYLIVNSDHGITFAVKHSWKTTKQTGLLKLFFTLVLAYIAGLIGVLFCIIGIFITWPIFYGTVASLYHEVFIEKLPPATQVEE